MDRNRLALVVVAALGLGVVGYLVRGSRPSVAAPDPSASGLAAASASASASASAALPATSSAAASDDRAAVHDGGVAARTEADGGATISAIGIGAGEVGDGGTSSGAVTIDETHAGTTIQLARGQKLVISLGSNPSTGFDWAVLKAPPGLGKPDMTSVAAAGEGAAGLRRLTFSPKDALPPGDHAVELGYQRSFEQGTAPLKTFRFNVRAAK